MKNEDVYAEAALLSRAARPLQLILIAVRERSVPSIPITVRSWATFWQGLVSPLFPRMMICSGGAQCRFSSRADHCGTGLRGVERGLGDKDPAAMMKVMPQPTSELTLPASRCRGIYREE